MIKHHHHEHLAEKRRSMCQQQWMSLCTNKFLNPFAFNTLFSQITLISTCFEHYYGFYAFYESFSTNIFIQPFPSYYFASASLHFCWMGFLFVFVVQKITTETRCHKKVWEMDHYHHLMNGVFYLIFFSSCQNGIRQN